MQRTILIAEDDKDIVNLLSLYLKNSGYEVLTAPDGLAAWGIFNREHVDPCSSGCDDAPDGWLGAGQENTGG